MQFRLAGSQDIDQLIRMRWDFTFEHAPQIKAEYADFQNECGAFLEQALQGGQWFIWIAEKDGVVISHIYIELIHKVPRPGRTTHPFAYMTNVYTLPDYRSQGVGGKLLKQIEQWGREKQLEFLMVWPSEEAVAFYARNGYKHCVEPMERVLE